MDPKLKEVFETEYAKVPKFVQSFIEKNSLKDKLEKYFADQNKDVEYNSFTAYINVMLGDADGDDDYEATFPLKDLPLLRKWFEAYSKKYPAKKDTFEMDHPIFGVGYQEAGEGAWKICAVDKLLEDKTVKVFDFDNGYSTVRMNVSKDESAIFENPYEGITDKPDSSSSYEELDDMLLAYASYWHAMDKKDEALIELPEIW